MQFSLLSLVGLLSAAEGRLAVSTDQTRLQRAAKFFALEAKELDSPNFLALAAKAQYQAAYDEAFGYTMKRESRVAGQYNPVMDSVKGMLRDMLAKTQDRHAADTSHHEFCQSELVSAEAKVKELQRRQEKNHADKDLMEATMGEDKEKIADGFGGLSKITKEIAKATDMKSKVEAMDESIDDINGGGHQRSSAGEISQLDDQLHELDGAKRRKERDTENLRRGIISKTKDLSELNRDIRGYDDQLKASIEYLASIKHQCVVPAQSDKQRKERREAEIDRLKEAQDILTGDDIPR